MANHIALGVSLAACAGLRAWMPLLALGLLNRFCGVDIHPSLQWIGGNTALIVFGAATVAELLGDKFPAVDNVLDTIGSVLRPGAAVVILTALASESQLSTALTTGLLIGVPTSLGIHLGKAGLRAGSTAFSLGSLNSLISLAEDIICVVLVVLAVLLPLLALVIAAMLLAGSIFLIVRTVQRRKPRASQTA